MRIYTRTGDGGETGLAGGGRVRKDAARVEAYGTVDEANAHVGLARALLDDPALDAVLERVQNDLFDLGSDLATPEAGDPSKPRRSAIRVQPAQVAQLEEDIDRLQADIPPLRRFILPGGDPAAAALHVARCVCRRAERRVVALAQGEPTNREALRYLNRLSDLLFVMARAVNARRGRAEPLWRERS
ncbi:MAG: cob(I)yrinic acid a,c-diamide adenosyltransferase [Armatimonadetes bacterium]|nr:cob(I)yrinic acid a,c-diamide adenosyltransferase [Armatimonadota bacterium]